MPNRNLKHTKRRITSSAIIALLIMIYVGLCLTLPIKALEAPKANSKLAITTPPSNLPWPQHGEGAVGFNNGTVIQSHGKQKPVPIASVAKLITALAVLKKYPLSVGQQGPMITIDATDYNIYTKYIAGQGSVVPVYTGEQLSEYQMLEAMLVPSGDNIADSLARWAYGSVSNYDSFANNYVKQLGLTNTHVGGDASGYLPTTTSTADNLIKLGGLVMKNPVLAQIVGMKSVNVPSVGVMQNYDTIIGVDGIIGIKTGNSNQAGGVFLGAAKTQVNHQTVTILTTILGVPNLTRALSDSIPLAVSLENNFAKTILINKGEVLGEFKQPWGRNVQITAQSNLVVYALQGQKENVNLHLNSLKIPSSTNSIIGTLSTPANQLNPSKSVKVVTLQSTSQPSWQWRLLHPNNIL
jgi:D-alanyl-D-alanine carboxypeptidase (penicillin-binding protein 5/6)